jgi:predicted RNA-binding Zn-ribbon protein involved in translation (DUF1610 family)
MTLIKIKDPEPFCTSPEHNPPDNITLPAGTYEYTCPNCGHKTTFTIGQVYC